MSGFKSCTSCLTWVPVGARFCVTCGLPFAHGPAPNFGPVNGGTTSTPRYGPVDSGTMPAAPWKPSGSWTPPVAPSLPAKRTSRTSRFVIGIFVLLIAVGIIGAFSNHVQPGNGDGVAALAGSPESRPTSTVEAPRTPTKVPTATTIPSPPLEILGMRSESNGIGGIYTYVRVINHTSRDQPH